MTVTRSIDSVGSRGGRVFRPVRCMTGGRLVVATVVACSLAATGCQSGMSMSKPSWWKFGGGGSGADAAKLAAAPTFPTDAKKPSETNTPYPTTSTPNGYVIAGSTTGGPPAAQAAPSIGPVVYGSTPPASTAAAAAAGPAAATVAQPQVNAAPQTGPYATLAGETIPPPGQPLPPIAPLSTPVAPPAAAAFDPQAAAQSQPQLQPQPQPQMMASPVAGPAYRTADASASAGYSNFSAPAGAEPPAAGLSAAGMPPAGTSTAGMAPGMSSAGMTSAGMTGAAAAGGRYGAQSASRFSSGPTPAAPASYGQAQNEAAFPPPEAVLPAGAPPAAAPLAPPASPGLLPQPATQPPVRRRDTGYRPFDTGSYQPSSTILSQEPAAAGAVRAVSFEQATGPVTTP